MLEIKNKEDKWCSFIQQFKTLKNIVLFQCDNLDYDNTRINVVNVWICLCAGCVDKMNT